MDEIELEVFRADDKASRGISSADIAALADAYNAEANPAPVVLGHPKSDSPAKGLIKAFRAEGSRLFATLVDLKDDLVEGIRDGSFINRSMAFFGADHEANPTPGKLAPRHLGFLGGSAPGIPGMSPLRKAFSFDAANELEIIGEPEEAIIFTAAPTPVRTIQEEPLNMADKNDDKGGADKSAEFEAREAELKRREEAAAEREKEFAASQERARASRNKGLVDGLVNAGVVLPADRDDLESVFNALNDDELEFSAKDDKGLAANKLAAIIGKGPKLVDDSGAPISPKGDKGAEFNAANADHRTISTKARELMSADKSLTFEAAVERVTNEKEG